MDDTTASQAPASSVFDRAFGLVGSLGGQYLTLKGQEKIATETLKAQERLNGYSRVNPSLGAVNPGAALLQAGKSPVQLFLPNGQPLVGTSATVGQSGALGGFNWQALIIPLAIGLGILLVIRKLLK